MKNKIIILFALIFLCTLNYNGGIWWARWAAWEFIAVACISFKIYQRYGFLASLCFLWPISGAILIYDGQIPITPQTANRVLSIENIVMRATLCWVFTTGAIALMKGSLQKQILDSLGILCLADSLLVIWQAIHGVPIDSRNGLVGTNASLNGCLIAVTYAFNGLWEIKYETKKGKELIFRIPTLIPIIAIFLEGASIPVGTLAVVLICFYRRSLKLRAIFPALVVLGIGFLFTPSFLFDSGRLTIWKASVTWWWENSSHLIGTGNGTFFSIGPMVQLINHIDPSVLFIWAHNDWLQTLIEQGFIGLFLFMSLFSLSLWRSWQNKRDQEFAAVMAYGAVSVFNFPAHSVLFAIVGTLLACMALDKERDQHEISAIDSRPVNLVSS